MTRYIKATFPTGHIMIELLQTPVVDKWLSVYHAYKKLNVPFTISGETIGKHGHPYMKELESSNKGTNNKINAVKKINDAIDNVNSLIQGAEFPYRAYDGMPWMHTNRLHRCFTTGAFTEHSWQHNLTQEQLLKCKTMGSREVRNYVWENATSQFKVIDRTKFDWHIHVINKQIHVYEDQRHSIVAEETINDYVNKYGYEKIQLQQTRKHIMWDKDFTFTDDKTCLRPEFCKQEFLETVTYEEMLSSFPDNYEDCNVTIHKSIGGKDYETCYSQYDDAMEADIRNIEHINGSMTVYLNNDHHKFFTGTRFYQWAKSYGLRDEMFLNVPIGKIVDNTVDVNAENNILSVEVL
jgi:hypothetical protein